MTKGKADLEYDEKSTQAYAALGIGFICIIVGLPLWWKTTEVYRVSLPYSEISRLSDSQMVYTVDLEVVCLDSSRSTSSLVQLAEILQNNLGKTTEHNLRSRYRVSVREGVHSEAAALTTANSIDDFDQRITKLLDRRHNKYFILLLPKDTQLKLSSPYLGQHRSLYISSDKDAASLSHQLATLVSERIVRETALVKSVDAVKGLRTLKPDKESMRSLRSKPGYDVTFTLISSQPDILNVEWDIEGGIDAYLQPFLNKLGNYTSITVKSQILFYAGFVAKPHQAKTKEEFYYLEQDLPHMINPLETKLVSHASNNPALNFLVYIPGRDQSPVYIRDSAGKNVPSNAFLSPRWGGILIYNIPSPAPGTPLPQSATVDMLPVMETFLTQLRIAFGLQAQVPKDMQIAAAGTEAITDWELDAWLRSRCVENLATSTSSLQSLAQLLGQISNIIINDDIGQEVATAVAAIQQSLRHLVEGKLEQAYLESKTAILASEKAFFDPSLLELLYFPEDQKFAIYIPLFLPVSIPVLMSLAQAYRWLRGKDKTKQD